MEDIHHTHQCTNESVGFCECEPLFEDYEIQREILVEEPNKQEEFE